jgi:uncharacterized Zn-binding protein involved in type VI secretion
MPAVARDMDPYSTGHGCTGVSSVTGPSTDVFVNGKGCERRGDPSVPHTVPGGSGCVVHTVNISSGSSTVFVNGRPCARVTDSIDAGQIIGGSPDVFAG